MKNDIQEKILKILKSAPSSVQMEEIADKLGLTRHTVAKYLEVLKAEGKIQYTKVGRTKLWKEISTSAIIRILKTEDIEDLVQIQERIERARDTKNTERMEYLKESVAYQLEHSDPLMNLGAEIDGKLVAFVLAEVRFWEFGHEEKTGWINWMGVDPEFQGKGIGRKLGANLFEYFGRKKVSSVRTLVDWYDGQILLFFKALDFEMHDTIVLGKKLEKE